MKKLHLSKELSLPLDAVTQTLAFLARKGAGKTYGASKLCEEMLDAGAQVVVLDPVGVWYGLRLEANGKTPGFPIPVLGGLHGDIQLEPGAGALIADLVVDRGTSVVLDVSMFRKGDRKRFATDFAEQLFHRKKAARSAVHLFIEEAQVFVPQRVQSDEARMLGAFEDLVKLGRNFGIGVTLISQRPQAVNKDALTQTECLIVLQTNGAQERKALKEWIVDQGLDIGDLVDSLPGLKRGEAWVWSPSWLGTTKRIHIAQKRTFNASATPEVGVRAVERELAPVDLEQLRKSMASVIQESEAKDPKALRKRVLELEAQVAKKAPPAAAKVEVREKPVLKEAQLLKLDSAAKRCQVAAQTLEAVAKEVLGAVWLVTQKQAQPLTTVTTVEGRRPYVPEPRAMVVPPPERVHASAPGGAEEGLKRGAREMLVALATFHPKPMTRHQLGTFVGLPEHGSTFTSYLSTLRKGGYTEDSFGGPIQITAAGLARVGEKPQAPATTQELMGIWLPKLKAGARWMIEQLVAHYPTPMSREQLGAIVGLPHTGSTFTSYLSMLSKNGLVEKRGDVLLASDTLFPAGRAA